MRLVTVFFSAWQEDLWGNADEGRESPRFTLLILDVEEQRGEGGGQQGAVAVPCAVVIIPRGRDRDFTFSSREGLEQVTPVTLCTRLRSVYVASSICLSVCVLVAVDQNEGGLSSFTWRVLLE